MFNWSWVILPLTSLIAIVTICVSYFFPKTIPLFVFVILILMNLGLAIFSGINLYDSKKNIEASWYTTDLRPRIINNIEYPTISLGTSKLQRAPGGPDPFMNLGSNSVN